MDPLPRVSGRLGQPIKLNVTFYRDGVPTDPFAIRRVSIYKSAVTEENLILQIPIVFPFDPLYPSPLTRELDSSNNIEPGKFNLIFDVPTDIPAPDIFFDVWEFIPDNPGIGATVGSDASDEESILDDETLWHRCCNEFWLFPQDGVFCDSGLTNIRLGFEAIDIKFNKPEVRTLEVGLMPLPLYDFEYNKIMPIIPQLKAFISIMTENCELIIDDQPMRIGLRQGTFRTNPFTLQYTLDTSTFLRGSYRYKITLRLPNGETRVSEDFNLQIS